MINKVRHRRVMMKYLSDQQKHKVRVILALEYLGREHKEDNVRIIQLSMPIPDGIMINWEKKEVTALEVSKNPQSAEKARSYKGSKWDHLMLIQIDDNLKRKKSGYLFRKRVVEPENY